MDVAGASNADGDGMTNPENTHRRATQPSIGALIATAVVAAAAGFGAVYAMARGADNGSGPAPAAVRVAQASPEQALPPGPGANPLSVGEMAKFVFKKAPEPLPEFTFLDGAGKERSLKDWRGRVVLLNIWATWCLPCRKEMPDLERLQAELGSDKFEVVALSVDRGGLEASKKFLDQIKVTKLGLYADPSSRASSTLKIIGMPATLLIDAEGREIGRLLGPAEWHSEDAKALVRAVVK